VPVPVVAPLLTLPMMTTALSTPGVMAGGFPWLLFADVPPPSADAVPVSGPFVQSTPRQTMTMAPPPFAALFGPFAMHVVSGEAPIRFHATRRFDSRVSLHHTSSKAYV
jgi:hypothetical protein